MRWTPEQFDDYNRRRVEAGHTRIRTGPVIQELKADCVQPQYQAPVHMHGQEEKAVDGQRYPQFRVSITYFVSDRRRRDAWGMAETVADCIVSATRRLLGTDAARKSGCGHGAKR